MSAIRNKQRLIHLYRYLMEYTDEEHQVTTNDLVEFLREEDANASRKTVKDDIEVLVEEGIDIIVNKSFYNSYFVGSRLFEVPEIQLLVDGIASNKSISKEKKEKIIGKLLSLLSVYQAEKVEKNLHYEDHYGSLGGQLYYNIADTILRTTLKDNYDLVNMVAQAAQEQTDSKLNIHLAPQQALFPEDRIHKIINAAADQTAGHNENKNTCQDTDEALFHGFPPCFGAHGALFDYFVRRRSACIEDGSLQMRATPVRRAASATALATAGPTRLSKAAGMM